MIFSHLSQRHDEHRARHKRHASHQYREECKNHENIANMIIAHIHELIRDDVVAVMRRAWRRHRVAVKIEDSKGDGEQRDELKHRRVNKIVYKIIQMTHNAE